MNHLYNVYLSIGVRVLKNTFKGVKRSYDATIDKMAESSIQFVDKLNQRITQ